MVFEKRHPPQNRSEVFSIGGLVLGKTDKCTTVKTKQTILKQWLECLYSLSSLFTIATVEKQSVIYFRLTLAIILMKYDFGNSEVIVVCFSSRSGYVCVAARSSISIR